MPLKKPLTTFKPTSLMLTFYCFLVGAKTRSKQGYERTSFNYPASNGFSRLDATLRWERNHCEQPFAFPSSMCAHVMTTNIQREDGNENFNETIGLISKKTTLHVHHAFIFAFLCHFCSTTTWRCLILRFMDNVNKQRRNLFSFSLLNLDMVPWNSTPFGIAYIWQSK